MVEGAINKHAQQFKKKMSKFQNIHKNKVNFLFSNSLYVINEQKSKYFYDKLYLLKSERSHMETVWTKKFEEPIFFAVGTKLTVPFII